MGLFSAIGNAVSSVSDAFGAVVDVVAGENTLIGGLADALGVSDVIEMATSGPGALLEALCDKLELPEWCGDVASGIANALSGNMVGLVDDVIDLSDNILEAVGADDLRGYLESARNIGDIAMDLLGGDFSSATDALDYLKTASFDELSESAATALKAALADETSLHAFVQTATTQLRA